MADLLVQCSTVLTAGESNINTMPAVPLTALAGKEAGPPLPRLDAAALRELIGISGAGVPLPDRNPSR